MLRRLEQALSPAILVALLLFFGVGLLLPLGHGLVEAVREPILEQPQSGESWSALGARLGFSETELRTLNKAKTEDKAPTGAVVVGYRWTLQHVLRLFEKNASEWRWLLNSFELAAWVTLVCAVISYPLAYLHARTSFWKQSWFAGLLLLPLILPPFVGAIGLRRMLAKYGTVNLWLMDLGVVDPSNPIDFLDGYQMAGCVIVMALHFYPLLYLNLAAAISNVDPSLIESSRSLGLTPWQTFRRVVLPLSAPGLVAGGSLVFVGAFTDLGTPLIFGYQDTIARKIYSLANEQTTNPAAPALVAVVTIFVLTLFLLTRWVLSRNSLGGVKGQSRSAPNPLSSRWTGLAVGLHVLVIGLALLPHVAVVLGAIGQKWFMTALPQAWTLDHLSEALGHPYTAMGVRNSLLYALISTAIDLVLGVACAWVIVRRGGVWGKLIDGLSVAPLAVPGLVLAFGYVGAYSGMYSQPQALLGVGAFLILSYSIRRLPYTVRACVAGLEQTPVNLEEASASLGRNPIETLKRVTVPLIAANVVAGGILAFSFAMLEVSDSIVLASKPRDYPLTKTIYALFGNPGNGDQLASALGLVAMLFLAFSLLAAGAFVGKKWGEMFKG